MEPDKKPESKEAKAGSADPWSQQDKEAALERLTKELGAEWVRKHKALLDEQGEYLKTM